jgi:hypothetical protein
VLTTLLSRAAVALEVIMEEGAALADLEPVPV